MKKLLTYGTGISVLIVLALAGFLYMKGELNKEFFLEGKYMKYFSFSSEGEIVRSSTNLLDHNKEREKYLLDQRMEVMYTDIISDMIDKDKQIRKRLWFMKDLSRAQIDQKLAQLEPLYDKEREKIKAYCMQQGSECQIKAVYDQNEARFSEISMKMLYRLDPESKAFFNEVGYVLKMPRGWYTTELIAVSDERYYLQDGNWQDRKSERHMESEHARMVSVDKVIEGHGWSVRIK